LNCSDAGTIYHPQARDGMIFTGGEDTGPPLEIEAQEYPRIA